MKRFCLLAIFVIQCSVLLPSCSVLMAMSGEREPDIGAIQIGSHRAEVEMQLGAPLVSNPREDGTRYDVYEYQIGNERSPGRAAFHGAMDVLTWGIWEFVGTPVEGFAGETRRIGVVYAEDDRVKSLKSINKGTEL